MKEKLEQKCIISKFNAPNIAQLYNIRLDQNLITNLRLLSKDYPSTFKYFIPEELFFDISNGVVIPLTAECYDRIENKRFQIDPLKELSEQLDKAGISNLDKLEIQLQVQGYELPIPPNDSDLLSKTSLAQKESSYSLQVTEKNELSQNNSKKRKQGKQKKVDIIDGSYKRVSSKKKLIVGIIIPLIIAGLALALWFMRDTSVETFEKELSDSNHTAAVDIYNDEILGNTDKEEKVNSQIENTIHDIESKYLSKQYTYEDACSYLNILSKIKNKKLSQLAADTLRELELHNSLSLIYNEAIAYIEQNEYIKAIQSLNTILEQSTTFSDTQEKLDICVDLLIKSVSNVQTEEEYLETIVLIESAMVLLPENDILKDYRNTLQNGYNNTIINNAIRNVQELISAKDYKGAFDCLQSALSLIPNNSELENTLVECQKSYVTYITNEVTSKLNNNEFQSALSLIDESITVYSCSEFDALYPVVKEKYIAYIINEVNAKVNNNEFEGALSLIEESQKVYSCSEFDLLYSQVKQKQEEIIASANSYSAERVTFVTHSGSISGDDQTNKYSITVPQNGYYRFYLLDMVYGLSVKLYVYASDGSRVGGDSSISNNEGITCQLKQGETYSIEVKSYSGTGDYTLKIGQQKALTDITSYNKVHDSLEYDDQKNGYTFIPQYSGVYRFAFSNMVSGFRLKIYIYDSLGNKVGGDSSISNTYGVTATLNAGETYRIEISQYSGFGDYTLNIGKQLPTEDITGMTTVAGTLTYTDQKNVYTYTASASGKYHFTLGGMASGVRIKLYVYDSLGYKVGGSTGLVSGGSITADLSEGQTYELQLIQNSSAGDYTITISKE